MRHSIRFVSMGLILIALGCAAQAQRDSTLRRTQNYAPNHAPNHAQPDSAAAADRNIDRARISRARTWAFLRNESLRGLRDGDHSPTVTSRVTSPLRDATQLDAEIARHITAALTALGFARVEREANLYVDYSLILQPRAIRVEGNYSQQFISSFSNSPSYIIEGTEITTNQFEDLFFEIDLHEPRGRALWRRNMKVTLRALDSLELRLKVDALLLRLPRSSGTR